MRHDPERAAAAYLGGTMSVRARRRFEAHIMQCDACWREVQLGRRGRAVAETGRELAPQFLRERIRSSVEALQPARTHLTRRVSVRSAVALAAVAALVAGAMTLRSDQPAAIDAVLADFHDDGDIGPSTGPTLSRRLGDLRLVGAERGTAAGMRIVAHSYVDRAGHAVTVYQSEDAFPVARGAEHRHGAPTWTADLGGTIMFCADRPVPSLVVGDDAAEVMMAAEGLGLGRL